MQDQVLARLGSDRNVKVHVVWTPVVPADDYAAAVKAQSFITDPRVTHYWDADRSLGIAYASFVELPEGNDTLAWDIYFNLQAGLTLGRHSTCSDGLVASTRLR